MSTEPYGLPIGSGIAGTVVVYGLFSAFISGPVILERETQKSGWHNQCHAIVETQIRQSQPTPKSVPRFKFESLFGGNDEASEVFGKLFAPLDDVLDQQYETLDRAKAFNEQRLQTKAREAGSRCNCAATMLSENRIALGLYAGSGRIVTPPLFKNLNAELKTALNSPRCAGRE